MTIVIAPYHWNIQIFCDRLLHLTVSPFEQLHACGPCQVRLQMFILGRNPRIPILDTISLLCHFLSLPLERQMHISSKVMHSQQLICCVTAHFLCIVHSCMSIDVWNYQPSSTCYKLSCAFKIVSFLAPL